MQTLKDSLKTIIVSLVVLSFVGVTYAWNPPTQGPTGGNVDAPLNTSIDPQTKIGNIALNALGISGSGNVLLVPNGNVGIGTTNPGAKLQIAGGGLHINGVQGAPSQGIAIGWNHDGGSGATWLINNAGWGGGGFNFDNVKDGVQTRLMTISETGTVCDGTGACIGGGGGGSIPNGYIEVYKNMGEDTSTYLPATGTPNIDTCNGDTKAVYECGVNEGKICRDLYQSTYPGGGYKTNKRTVTCIAAIILVKY